MQFPIHNRVTGAVQFIAEINCSEDTPLGIKIGLAVKWALKNGADLRHADLRYADLRQADLSDADLGGAYLRHADLSHADLSHAYLRQADLRYADLGGADLGGADLGGADLRGADLRGAYLGDHKIKRLIANVTRISDGCEAHVFETVTGEIIGKWGCRTTTLTEFSDHVEGYADPDKRAETRNIIAFVRAEAERLGIGVSAN